MTASSHRSLTHPLSTISELKIYFTAPKMLCDVCASINLFSEPYVHNWHHANFADVQQAAEQGCELCQQICAEARSAFKLQMDSELLHHIVPQLPANGIHKRRIYGIKFFQIAYNLAGNLRAEFEIYVEHGCGPGLASTFAGSPNFSMPDPEGCFELIDTWMTEYIETHADYCSSQTESPLPTRVLDVGNGRTQKRCLLENHKP
jgi:hypothetical protein